MSKHPVEIKISTVVAISTILHSAQAADVEAALRRMTGGVADFFEDEFAVIDVSNIQDQAIDFPALVALLKQYNLNAVAVRGATAAMEGAIRALGLTLDDSAKHTPDAPAPATAVSAAAAPAPAPAPAARPAPSPAPAPAPASASTVYVDQPVRAGQRIYARGADLVITAAVNNGAEVIADGSIHVYAPLFGRALAGAAGNAEARIFALAMEPELVSIAGVYRTFEEGFPKDLARQPVQVRLAGERIEMQPVART
ncbi:septum site-determining protein MinC [Massilia sp. TS11]|uniref:septum site-determining protein MinC n=1 Tax=Massilia sp. TS11 TaxID=2908003 RepID=UPI001EDA3143|nr:septum site-determining protein MinC [Massilia sp. TS11]MCG2585768.1 septum site-determining protein MinC [Massilia sp. TS11]